MTRTINWWGAETCCPSDTCILFLCACVCVYVRAITWSHTVKDIVMIMRNDGLTHEHALFPDTVCREACLVTVRHTLEWSLLCDAQNSRLVSHTHTHTHTHKYIYIYTQYIYICVYIFLNFVIIHENSFLICELRLNKQCKDISYADPKMALNLTLTSMLTSTQPDLNL